MVQNKKGVSLIVVLLFMLVATIAATATYRWITSEERSSASRMLQEEAYQSSVAGIESARSWMAYHANDVGALIKQYKDGGNKPIKLTNRFVELAKAGQNYDVWLIGVNTEKSTYKMKILSEGRARNGAAKHNELAIMNVDGLYQVQIPSKKNDASVDFDYAYFGGSYSGAGNVKVTSAVVNGNWSGNPQEITKNFVVTGNATLSGNNVRVGQLACVGGDFSIQNNGLTGNDLYVGGNATGNFQMSGDVYFDGNAGTQEGGESSVAGSMTLNGRFVQQANKAFSVGANLCTSEKGMVFSQANDASHQPFTVNGHVWMPGNLNVFAGDAGSSSNSALRGYNNFYYYDRIILGAQDTSRVYIKTAHPASGYESFRKSKKFTETSSNNYRICSQSTTTPVCLEYGWCGWGLGRCCKKWDNENTCTNWINWGGSDYFPYAEKESNRLTDDKYYIYFMKDGVKDVEFKTEYNSYWGENIASYYVGGALFYNLWDVWNEFNYNSDAPGISQWWTFTQHALDENGEVLSSPYCRKNGSFSNGSSDINAARPVCEVMPWFKSNGKLFTTLPSEPPFECAEKVKDNCDSIWEKKPGCDGSSYKVDDVLTTGYKEFEQFANKGCAASITEWNSSLVQNLNDCYKKNIKDDKQENLYNGYLVVNVHGGTSSTNPSGTLDGKFIIIAEDPIYARLPPTTNNTYVFLYLKNGAANLNDATVKNYFIFTLGNIQNGLQFNLTGTIYAAASTCAGLGALQSSSIEYSADVIQEMTSAGIICDKNQVDCGGVKGSSSSGASSASSSTDESFGAQDGYYIATSPQLGVAVESQYKNNEKVDDLNSAESASPSFIVLPRVVYLTQQAPGRLEDYYGVIPLNTKAKVLSPSVSCDGGISTTGVLYNGTNDIPEGYYTCQVTGSVEGNSSTVPFFVVVKGSSASSIYVSFKEPSVKVAKGAEVTLSLVTSAPTSTAQAEYEVSMLKPSDADGWTISALDGVTCSGNVCKVKISSVNSETPVFKVSSSLGTGSLTFFITESSGCLPGTNPTETVIGSSFVTVTRKEISECTEPECVSYQDEFSRPNCTADKTWITVSGTDCSPLAANNSWTCGVSGNISAQAVGNIPVGCEAIIPAITLVGPFEENSAQVVYGSLKAKKSKFTVKYSGPGISGNPGIVVNILGSTRNEREVCTYDNAKDDGCTYSVYTGEEVRLSFENEEKEFNYWSCEGGNCPTDVLKNETFSIPAISGDNSVVAHFNEKDSHCFFDEFTGSAKCESNISDLETAKYCISTSGKEANAKWFAAKASNLDVDDVLEALDYSEGRISLKKGAVDKMEANKPAVVIMSSVDAGLYGTLTAQFMVPRMGSGSNISSATVKQSGFVLRADVTGQSFWLLNIYANSSGNLAARVCLLGGDCLKEKELLTSGNSSISIGSTEIVSMNAKIQPGASGDELVLTVVSGYSGNTTTNAVFNLRELSSPAAFSDRSHQYVGFALSDPNFKLYDIGWSSEDYGSQCWDTPPTIKCSFKAAYVGGIVPKDKDSKPWVGFSSWFDAHSCTPAFWYKGSDACGGSGVDYVQCDADYSFSESGAHGYMENDKEIKMAKAQVSNCGSYSTESAQMAALTGEATCGSFWVGEQTNCHEDVLFESANGSAEYFVPSSGMASNLRDAVLVVELENESAAEIHVSLCSQSSEDSYTYGGDQICSLPFSTNDSGKLTFRLADVENVDGFDIEKIRGVYVKNMESGKSIGIKSVQSSCDHVLKIKSCSAAYNGGIWNISAEMENAEDALSYEIVQKVDGSEKATKTDNCSGQNTCKMTGNKYEYDWLENLDDYASNLGKSYQFEITPKGNHGEAAGSPCLTDSVTAGAITASCHIEKTSVEQGKGIPVVTYSLKNCPDNKCGYKIMLDSETSVGENSQTGNFENYNTVYNVANISDALVVGEHSITMESTNPNRPFDLVKCGSFSVNESTGNSSSSSEAVSSSSSAGAITATCNVMYNSAAVSTIYTNVSYTWNVTNISGASGNFDPTLQITATGYSQKINCGTSGCWNNGFTTPITPGNYEYKLIYDENVICSATFEVKPALTCSADKTEIALGESFTLSTVYAGDAWNCELSGNGATSACNSSHTISPTALGAQTYVYKVTNGSKGYAECSVDVSVEEPPPTITCPDDMTKPIGATVSVTPKSLSGCAGGCYYTIDGTGATGSGYTGGAVSFTGESSEGSKSYTFTVTNSVGTASCPFTVTYKESSVNVVDMEKGQENVVVPCGSSIHATGTCNENTWGPLYLTVECTGSFEKTVGTSSAGQYNSVSYNFGNAYEGFDGTVTTKCPEEGQTMNCKLYCNWN